ncbi:YHS domain-containing (seleno)protein [Coralliovum pocilloporae]|uniref:YHS domain-containing (seleno)protein n=1 Tax=Coralliovum pocilloporae TaxID=3066369 RepID=UPI003306B504
MRRSAVLLAAVAGFLTLAAFREPDMTTTVKPQDLSVNSVDGVALSGYDPVAYFRQGRPAKGKTSYTYRYNGVVWAFENKENRSTFAIDPAAYVPQFGGYSAYDVAKGMLKDANPETWSIIDGRLYLNRDDTIASRWDTARAQKISRAQAYWDSIFTP